MIITIHAAYCQVSHQVFNYLPEKTPPPPPPPTIHYSILNNYYDFLFIMKKNIFMKNVREPDTLRRCSTPLPQNKPPQTRKSVNAPFD